MREAESTGTKPAKTVVRKNSAQFAAVCQELLQRGLHLRFTAHGKSMQPNILSEDQVVIAPASERELVRGQVAFAQGREGFRIHRLIRDVATGSAAITRGDAGQEQDPAAQQQILGRAIAIVRKGREISLDRPWTPRLHAARAFFRKVRMAVRRRAARGFLLCVPALILLQLLTGAAPVKAVSVTITQTPSVTTVSPGGTITYTDTLTNNSTTQTVNTEQYNLLYNLCFLHRPGWLELYDARSGRLGNGDLQRHKYSRHQCHRYHHRHGKRARRHAWADRAYRRHSSDFLDDANRNDQRHKPGHGYQRRSRALANRFPDRRRRGRHGNVHKHHYQ